MGLWYLSAAVADSHARLDGESMSERTEGSKTSKANDNEHGERLANTRACVLRGLYSSGRRVNFMKWKSIQHMYAPSMAQSSETA